MSEDANSYNSQIKIQVALILSLVSYGNKKVLCSWSQDCTAFGFLCVIFYVYPEDHYFRVEAEKRFPNLKMFVERIKETYWPDWDDLLEKNQ